MENICDLSISHLYSEYQRLTSLTEDQRLTIEALSKVHVVTMHRWGDEESHNYVLGAFSSKGKASKAGDVEWTYRGCKYEAKVTECLIDRLDDDKIKFHESCK